MPSSGASSRTLTPREGKHLPNHDAAHVCNAIARFNQTGFDSAVARERAGKNFLAAVKWR
jgi:hypothetical protein